MPYTPKQMRFLEGIAHGMKPRKGGPSQGTAKKMVSEVGNKATRAPIKSSTKRTKKKGY
jgi:hypothetical protein